MLIVHLPILLNAYRANLAIDFLQVEPVKEYAQLIYVKVVVIQVSVHHAYRDMHPQDQDVRHVLMLPTAKHATKTISMNVLSVTQDTI